MKNIIATLILCFAGCTLSESTTSESTDELTSIGGPIQPDTVCTFVIDDCNTWLGDQTEKNRLCTQACGGPAVCTPGLKISDYICATSVDNCASGTTWHNGTTPCGSAVTCSIIKKPVGLCQRSTGAQ